MRHGGAQSSTHTPGMSLEPGEAAGSNAAGAGLRRRGCALTTHTHTGVVIHHTARRFLKLPEQLLAQRARTAGKLG